MKTTIDIPDDLYRRVKAKAALEGRTVREATIDLYRAYVVPPATDPAEAMARLRALPVLPDEQPAVAPRLRWLEESLSLGTSLFGGEPANTDVRDALREDRARLDAPGEQASA